MSYNRFRSPEQIEFPEAYAVQFRRAKAFAAMGDYSKPATRAATLGKMREWKLEAWRVHQFVCGENAALEALLEVDQEDLAARGKWVELDAVQDAIREVESSLGIESVPF